jgi:hypothetical protein
MNASARTSGRPPATAPGITPSKSGMAAAFRDVVYALRKLGSARVFTATAVLTLALGIGGTTAIFTLMHAVMLKSLWPGASLRRIQA